MRGGVVQQKEGGFTEGRRRFVEKEGKGSFDVKVG